MEALRPDDLPAGWASVVSKPPTRRAGAAHPQDNHRHWLVFEVMDTGATPNTAHVRRNLCACGSAAGRRGPQTLASPAVSALGSCCELEDITASKPELLTYGPAAAVSLGTTSDVSVRLSIPA